MAHGHLLSLMPAVMNGSLVPMAVGGEALVSVQFPNVGQPVLKHLLGSAITPSQTSRITSPAGSF